MIGSNPVVLNGSMVQFEHEFGVLNLISALAQVTFLRSNRVICFSWVTIDDFIIHLKPNN